MTTDTPTPADQLHAYYQLSDRVVPEGFAWPRCIDFGYHADGYVTWCRYHDTNMDPDHALAIVERTAEDWLRERGWRPSRFWGMYFDPVRKHDCDLPAALAAEIEKGVG